MTYFLSGWPAGHDLQITYPMEYPANYSAHYAACRSLIESMYNLRGTAYNESGVDATVRGMLAHCFMEIKHYAFATTFSSWAFHEVVARECAKILEAHEQEASYMRDVMLYEANLCAIIQQKVNRALANLLDEMEKEGLLDDIGKALNTYNVKITDDIVNIVDAIVAAGPPVASLVEACAEHRHELAAMKHFVSDSNLRMATAAKRRNERLLHMYLEPYRPFY